MTLKYHELRMENLMYRKRMCLTVCLSKLPTTESIDSAILFPTTLMEPVKCC